MQDRDAFFYREGSLACEGVSLAAIAETHGTPAYLYSKQAILARFNAYEDALQGVPHRVCYAVKANSNLAVLAALASVNAGFDIVSGGELFRVLKAGGDPSSVVFSGVGKTADEISYALDNGIGGFNCESEAELHLLSRIASGLGRTASVALRVNPDVDAVTHPYISTGLHEHKFGVSIGEAESLYRRAAQLPGLSLDGVSCHIGSQLMEIGPLLEAASKSLSLVERLRSAGLPIRHLDLGGGLGVAYRQRERAPGPGEFIEHILPRVQSLGLTLMLEPGRSIVAAAGVLLTRVLLVKQNGTRTFIIVDAAMNDLLRPALYQAHHDIVPVQEPVADAQDEITADVVGPVCETGDFFARSRNLPPVRSGDLLAIRTAGAYGFVLSSNYNSRPRSCELLIDGTRIQIARRRETLEDLIRGESLS